MRHWSCTKLDSARKHFFEMAIMDSVTSKNKQIFSWPFMFDFGWKSSERLDNTLFCSRFTKTWVLRSSLDGWTHQVNLKFSCNQFLEIFQAPYITFISVLEPNNLKIDLEKNCPILDLISNFLKISDPGKQFAFFNVLLLRPLHSVKVCGEIRRSWICYRWHLFFSTRARLAGNILVLCKRL